MYIFALFILIVFAIAMFKVEQKYKLAILLFCSICLTPVALPVGPIKSSTGLLTFCFLISELKNIILELKRWKHSVIFYSFIVALIGSIIFAVTSPHYSSIEGFIKLLNRELTAGYFILIYAFISIKTKSDLQPSVHAMFWGLLILTFFGIINYLTKEAFFIQQMADGTHLEATKRVLENGFAGAVRFRVQSMFINPFDYGYICLILLPFLLYTLKKDLLSKKRFIICIGCCVFGILTCGCRTNLFCAIIGICVYFLFSYSSIKRIKYGLIIFVLSIFTYITVPFIQEKVDEMTTIFDQDGGDVTGSSISMRVMQYSAVLYHVDGHELFGRGADYFLIDLGWGDNDAELMDEDLWGLEGVLMAVLLERGIIGIIFYSTFYFLIFISIYKQRHHIKDIAAFGLATLCAYLAFANSTGELLSKLPTLLLLGICLKLIYIKNQSSKDDIIYASQEISNYNSRV